MWLLIIFSVGAAFAADDWNEVPMTDYGEYEGLEETYDYAGDGSSAMAFRLTEGPDSLGETGTTGLAEAYYSMDAPTSGGTGVQKYMISGHEPTTIYYGGQSTSYSTYSTAFGGVNSLWIMGSWSWTQYATCPLGGYLQLLAYSSAGGSADFYEIYPSGSVDRDTYSFWPGYTRINFHADTTGRHILLFITNNQPSNAVIIDVSSGGWPPGPGPSPSSYAKVTIRSSWIKGYSVSVDDIYSYSDSNYDGVVSFNVNGNQYHNIKITSPGFTRTYYRFFRSGYAYTLTM